MSHLCVEFAPFRLELPLQIGQIISAQFTSRNGLVRHQPFKYQAKLGLLLCWWKSSVSALRSYLVHLGFVYRMSPVFMVCGPCSVDLVCWQSLRLTQ